MKGFELTLGILLLLGSLGVRIYRMFEYPLGILSTSTPIRCILIGLLQLAFFLAGVFLIIMSLT